MATPLLHSNSAIVMLFFYTLFSLLGFAYGLDLLTPLRRLLSPSSRIDGNAPRWSEYPAPPSPAPVVHPATVSDVQITIRWAATHNIPFLVYNGGNGWAANLKLDHHNGFFFYLALDLLRSVTFNPDKTVATIGAGALTADVVHAGSDAGSLVATATCDCVGFLGALLGGGASHLTGQYGLLVDTVLSMDVVLSDGSLRTVTGSSDPDLWWALRGAGPNFGVVVEVEVAAHPDAPLTAWQGSLVFSPDKLGSVLDAVAGLTTSLPPPAALALLYAAHDGSPAVIVDLFFHGSAFADEAAECFASLLTLGPVSGSTSMKQRPWKAWNAPSAFACRKGGRKPTWGAGLSRFDPVVFAQVYDVWHDVAQQPGAANSSMLLNWFPMDKARSLPLTSSAVPFRHEVGLFPTLTIAYEDAVFDEAAVQYGRRARALWQAADGLGDHHMTVMPERYINNAFGDEPLEVVYGYALDRLRRLKKRYDPTCRFSRWFPLLPS
ncbi:hypothetical protein L249_8060 [Ophiocordyceps polyrhachis-furcata BCC 54312]|uniref:FAD-binding PCMH-type domain-containing protein n=1 Tax=Ophiocordyceps polyrhachis-furcata BCC 54312 TaxID=1330021 RepID=A0A367LHD9_9HYPO|nr:hypothetical protein L249_8060 [Ophiocordyceps polyrhachis-furcata BCC 54312]